MSLTREFLPGTNADTVARIMTRIGLGARKRKLGAMDIPGGTIPAKYDGGDLAESSLTLLWPKVREEGILAKRREADVEVRLTVYQPFQAILKIESF